MIRRITAPSCLLRVGISFGLALGVWIVFGQTLRHEFVNVDDDVYVTENAHVAGGLTWRETAWAFKNLQAGFWQPLTWLSFMADAEMHGQRAGGFHLTNVLWHIANTLLLYFLLCRLTAAHWRSAFVAALFAIHPLHVESVGWISERKGLISTFFFLVSLWAYARYRSDVAQQPPTRITSLHRSRWYWLALLSFACGLMSKTMIVTLPVVMLLLDYWPLRRFSTPNPCLSTLLRLLTEKIPFFVMSLVAGWLTVYAEKDIGAMAQGESLSLKFRLANTADSTVHYLWQTIWPTDLAVLYPYPTSFPSALVLGLFALLALVSVIVLWVGRRFPYLAVGWFWYLVTLSPVSGVIQVGGHARADRYMYIPLIGIFLLATWGLAELCVGWRHRNAILRAGSAAILAALGIVAHSQTKHWHDSISLWTHALACTPDNPEARHNLADAFAAQARWPEAVEQYERALQLKPDHVLAHDALGVALATQGRLDDALPHFERAVQLRPTFAAGHYNFSIALATKGRWDEAMRECETVIRLKPDHAEAHQNLAVALAAHGKLDDAVQHFQQALNLANAQGKPALAEAIRSRLQSIQPNPPQPQSPMPK